jgi:diaminopimelate decarboxylase
MYGSYHPIVNISNLYGEAKENYDIGGPYCESGDIFARERKIPLIKEGDLLSIEIAGAYGYSMSSNYNLRRRPIEVLVTPNNEILIIRKRETTASLIEGGM